MLKRWVCPLVAGFQLWLKSGQIRIKSLIWAGRILILFCHDGAEADSRSVSAPCVCVCVFPSGMIVEFPADCVCPLDAPDFRGQRWTSVETKHRQILVVMRRESLLYLCSTLNTFPFFFFFLFSSKTAASVLWRDTQAGCLTVEDDAQGLSSWSWLWFCCGFFLELCL